VQHMPHACPAAGDTAAQTGGAGELRELRAFHLSRGRERLKVLAWVDGASRGNPGPAGYGAFLETPTGEIIEACGYLGVTTNNVAEYSGLLEAMAIALAEGASELDVTSDSLLLVNQMQGKYRVKHPNLIPLYERAKTMARKFTRFSIRHTLRAGNKDADRLANLAVDRADGKHVERHRPENE
jgi:Ribonuclease HI